MIGMVLCSKEFLSVTATMFLLPPKFHMFETLWPVLQPYVADTTGSSTATRRCAGEECHARCHCTLADGMSSPSASPSPHGHAEASSSHTPSGRALNGKQPAVEDSPSDEEALLADDPLASSLAEPYTLPAAGRSTR
jgi:hypothetical protein